MRDNVLHIRSTEPAIATISEARRSALPTQDISMIWIIVTVVCIGSFMGQLDASITQLVLPAVEREFSASIGEVSWVAPIFLLVVTVMLPVFGRLSDMFGRKK
jgi:MFS family permease